MFPLATDAEAERKGKVSLEDKRRQVGHRSRTQANWLLRLPKGGWNSDRRNSGRRNFSQAIPHKFHTDSLFFPPSDSALAEILSSQRQIQVELVRWNALPDQYPGSSSWNVKDEAFGELLADASDPPAYANFPALFAPHVAQIS
jgi:hypothetical protein